jgi:predicted porin
MNKKLGLAVAGALVAFSSAANAGITIPAGDWTLDVGGVVNAYYTSTRQTGTAGGLAGANDTGSKTASNITTGLLPNYLAVSGKSRQNDLDIAFTISINPGASTTHAGIQSANQENRQAFLTIGDASWGSVKLGKDLGIYASDAILNDMTLLGVGSAGGMLAGNTTTLGRIGTGFIYADWKSQVAYTSPNWNGFQFTAGVTQAWDVQGDTYSTGRGGSTPAYEAKASYSWTGDVAGKVWASAISQRVEGLTNATSDHLKNGAVVAGVANTIKNTTDRANAIDVGAHIDVANLGLTAYYNKGEGMGQTVQLANGFDNNGKSRESKDWYVQATYVLPTTTKLGLSYGESTLDGNSGENMKDNQNRMWTVGAYHPITKSVNLVAEYSDVKNEYNDRRAGKDTDGTTKTVSLGAILFF